MEKKRQLDTNKMHLEEFQRIMQSVDRDEARAAAHILVRRYPDVIVEETGNYMLSMRGKIADLTNVIGGSTL